jgi:UDP-N-acetylmuramoyl-L-alanyl-D-glutamate--2,6-diaminopimelate ligase
LSASPTSGGRWLSPPPAFTPRQPETVVAVTGTSGKSSVADFARQLFATLGHRSASVGTLGVVTSDGAAYGSLTTPDPVALHETLDRLAGEGVTHLAMEASSHGLDQRRLDGVRLKAGGFTNLGHDHLDYHATTGAYREAKLRLVETLLPDDSTAVINADGAMAEPFVEAAAMRGLRLMTTGHAGTRSAS